jgi:hypothetical protein
VKARFVLLVATVLTWGCADGSSQPASESEKKPAAAAKGPAGSAAPAGATEVPVAADFEVRAEREISEENYEDALDGVEKELASE